MGRPGRVRIVAAVLLGAACLLSAYAAEVASQKPAQRLSQDSSPSPRLRGEGPGVRGSEIGSKPAEQPKQDGFHLLSPPNRSVLLSGDFDLICKAEKGRLEVDGDALEWEPFEPPLRVAHLSLYPGRAKIRIGAEQLEVFVARTPDEPGGPEGWEVYRRHPINGQGAKRCAACHRTEQHGDRAAVGELDSPKACFECHETIEFEADHCHPLEPLEHCQACHALHGSKHKALLKAPIKKLCDECHES